MEVSSTRLITRIVINSIEDSEVLCPSLQLVLDSDTHVVSTTIVLILGLPINITKKELDIFLEPFASDINGICLIHEQKLCGELGLTYEQHQNSALIFFTNENASQAFRDLYNNMQLPSYSDTAPCIVISPIKLEVLLPENFTETFPISLQSSFHTLKLSNISSKHSNTLPVSYESTIYTMGIEQLLQYQVGSFPSELPSIELVSKSTTPIQMGSASSTTNISTDSIITTSLPTCTICMRRIRGVSTLSDSLTGTNELIIGRSYLCENVQLTFDEVNNINLHKNTECSSVSEGIIGKEGYERTNNRLDMVEDNKQKRLVKCYPCYVYQAVVTSKRIGSPHRDNPLQQLLSMASTQESSGSSSHCTTATSASTGCSEAAAGNIRTNEDLGTLGKCTACSIPENIWMCLICGHTGCGRYTSQHAKAHYHKNSSHNLSLELASGRIWNYHTDTFCYYEDESVSNPLPVAALHPRENIPSSSTTFRTLSCHTTSVETNSSSDMAVSDPSNTSSLCQSSSALTKKFITPTFLYPNTPLNTHATPSYITDTTSAIYSSNRHNHHKSSRYFSTLHPTTDSTSGSGMADCYGLDSSTADKVTALMNNYENLLEAQLQDQQLYFEKLLARETVRALEQSFQYNTQNNQNHATNSIQHEKKQNINVGNNKKIKSISTTSTKSINNNNIQKERYHSSSGIEEKTENENETEGDEHELNIYRSPSLHTTSLLTNSTKYKEAMNIMKNPDIQLNFQEVEELKLIITAAEADYRNILYEIKEMDSVIRILKKDNDVLIKAQKELQAEEVKVKSGTELLQRKSAELVADMKQQIQDLTFYTKTRQQVQESSLRDEIQHGTVITSQKPTPNLGKKGSFKKG